MPVSYTHLNILGEALADAIAFSSPEAIVLVGGLAKSGDYIMKPIQKAIDDNILNIDVYKRQRSFPCRLRLVGSIV